MPCLPVERSKNTIPDFGAALAERLDHRIGQGVGIGLAHLVGRDNVIHRGKGAVGHGHLEAEVPHHPECLRARHLMDQVGADQELRLSVRQRSHGVGIPYLLE